jgi:hypothetical protein
MNKLREKFDWYLSGGENCPESDQCEQITDDFSVKFVKWYNVSKYDFPNEMTIEEKQQYFKENVYEN